MVSNFELDSDTMTIVLVPYVSEMLISSHSSLMGFALWLQVRLCAERDVNVDPFVIIHLEHRGIICIVENQHQGCVHSTSSCLVNLKARRMACSAPLNLTCVGHGRW